MQGLPRPAHWRAGPAAAGTLGHPHRRAEPPAQSAAADRRPANQPLASEDQAILLEAGNIVIVEDRSGMTPSCSASRTPTRC